MQLELAPGFDEAAVLDRLGLLQDDDAVRKIFHLANQPGTRLRQRFQHQDSRHHGKPGK